MRSPIVTAGLASDLLTGSEMLHGEWYLGSTPVGALEQAHMGFIEGVGDLRVISHCVR